MLGIQKLKKDRNKNSLYRRVALKYLFLVLNLGLLSCTTGTLNVRTTPDEAEVLVVFPGQQPSRLGRTPLSLDSDSLSGHAGDSVELILKKEGYSSEHFLIPKTTFAANIRLDVALNESKLPVACADQDAAVEEVARSIAQAQSFIAAKMYEGALRILQNLGDRYPNSSVIYDLLGNAYYLMKDLEKALVAYQKSLKISPNNSETQRMVKKLSEIYSVRSSAGK